MNRIGEVLKDKGLKQKWLADQLGMSTVMVSLYSSNKRQPKLTTLILIGRILKVEVNQLIDSNPLKEL
jgi:putative transcriptional regulator